MMIGSFIVIISILAILFVFKPSEESSELTSEEILGIIKPEIQSYCQNLDKNAILSHCLICGGTYSGELEYKNYLYVEDFEEGSRERYKYIIKDKEDVYNVTSQVYLIAGRNDRPAGHSILSFEIDKKRNILNSDIPEIRECS